MLVCSVQIISRLDSKRKFHMLYYFIAELRRAAARRAGKRSPILIWETKGKPMS